VGKKGGEKKKKKNGGGTTRWFPFAQVEDKKERHKYFEESDEYGD